MPRRRDVFPRRRKNHGEKSRLPPARETSPAVRDLRAASKVARQTRRHCVRLVESLAPVNKRPEVIDRFRLAAASVTDEGIALEDRASKLLARSAHVDASALVAIGRALGATPMGERPVPRAQPQDRHAPSVFASPSPIGFVGSDDPELASYL